MRKAFTFIEMIFVLLILAILAKFGSEIFRNVYTNYTLSTTNNKLQTDTENAIEQISNRLQYRIKDSVIASNGLNFTALASATNANNFNILEWVGYDIDGWLGDGGSTLPTWSGFIDVDDFVNSSVNSLVSPASDFSPGGRVDSVIQAVSGTSTVDDAAIFFTGANSNVFTDYGWDSAYPYAQDDTAAHRITATGGLNMIAPFAGDDFSNVDIYEQYKLSWTAYALELDNDGTLKLYYNFQPWNGENYNSAGASSAIIMENVSTFKFKAVGDMLKVQICVDDNNITGKGEYAVCKEKAIF